MDGILAEGSDDYDVFFQGEQLTEEEKELIKQLKMRQNDNGQA
jgi:hypothetical protein